MPLVELVPLEMTDRACASCGSMVWATTVTTDLGTTELAGCPTCDRPRCKACREPFGFLFAQQSRVDVSEDGAKCEPCRRTW